MGFETQEVLYRKGYDIGIGVAMSTGSPMALGAKGEVTPPQIGTGGSGSFTFRRIDTTEELQKELGISADVSGGIGLFSASDSFNFSERCRIQSSSITILISATEDFAFQQMDSPELTRAAADRVERGEPLSEQFGEYFIRGISTGGRFFGVIRIDTKSMQTKTDLDNELSGSYGLMVSGDVKLKLSESLSRANARAEAFINYEGGRVTIHPTSNDPIVLMEQLFKAVDEWTASVRSEPKPYSVTIAPYIIALGPNPPNIAEIDQQRDVLIRCSKLRSQTLDKLNLVEYILDPKHIDEFNIIDPPVGPDLPALQATLAAERDVIAETASYTINNIKSACDPEVYMKDVKGIANFKFTPLPNNMPQQVKIPKASPSIVVPNCIGLTLNAMNEFTKQTGLKWEELILDEAEGVNPYSAIYELTLGLQKQVGEGWDVHPHSADQIVVTAQQQPAGSLIPSSDPVLLSFDTAPGVPY